MSNQNRHRVLEEEEDGIRFAPQGSAAPRKSK